MNEEELTKQAEANVGFYRHLLMYVLINGGLFAFDYYDNAQFDWAYFAFLAGA